MGFLPVGCAADQDGAAWRGVAGWRVVAVIVEYISRNTRVVAAVVVEYSSRNTRVTCWTSPESAAGVAAGEWKFVRWVTGEVWYCGW